LEEQLVNFGEVQDQVVGEKPIKEVEGSLETMELHGSPSQCKDYAVRYYFYPTWRSQLFPLLGFLGTSIACISLSRILSVTVIKGPLFTLFGYALDLHLPLLILLPGFVLGRILIYMYDSKYIVDERGVEAQIGLVSLSLRQPRLRFEDIRGVEPVQTLWERILGIGGVLIGSAMTQDVEIVMEGVDNPRAIQLLIGGERDRMMASAQGGEAARTMVQE